MSGQQLIFAVSLRLCIKIWLGSSDNSNINESDVCHFHTQALEHGMSTRRMFSYLPISQKVATIGTVLKEKCWEWQNTSFNLGLWINFPRRNALAFSDCARKRHFHVIWDTKFRISLVQQPRLPSDAHSYPSLKPLISASYQLHLALSPCFAGFELFFCSMAFIYSNSLSF